MRYRILSIAALFVVGTVSSAHAQASKTVKCKDGTTSTATGAGACSGHGGVAPATSKSSKAAASTAKKTEKAAEQTAKKTEKTAELGTKKTASAATKPGAKVTCTDGTLSKPGRGACSGHGGVKKA
jgi:hypothetical protein